MLPAARFVVVVDGFRAVPVGIEEERAVVVVPVLRTRAGGAVVAVAGRRPDPPELVDVSPRGRRRTRYAAAS